MTLTKHSEGSFRELWTISLPLMLSSFSLLLMIFVDRLFLANYSLEAQISAVNASTLGWSFIVGWMVLTSISEVFVAQYNGAGEKHKIGKPVWQMIWVSFASILFFLPMALYFGDFIFGASADNFMKKDYFFWMIVFGPSSALYGALCGFFVGRGKTKLITTLSLVANGLNILLDYALIFGIEGVIPSMGVKGAAIATSSSSIFQVIILGCIFLNSRSRKEFGTGDYRFDFSAFKKYFRIGAPSALFVTIEILAWASYYWMMTLAGEKYITVAAICQNVLILLFFVSEGVNKAAITISGNLIGAKREHLISKMTRGGVRLHLYFFLLMMTFVFFGHDFIIAQFLPTSSPEFIASIHDTLVLSLYATTIYILFEGLRMLYTGVLTAAGDTFFLLASGSAMIWLCLIFPIYFIVLQWKASPLTAVLICTAYSIVTALVYLWRFHEGRWKKLSLTT